MLKDYTAKLVDIQKLTPTVNNFIFELDDELEFKAGQFVNISFIENEELIRKPYSIASSPSNKQIELCIKHVEEGKLTPLLFQKEIGFELNMKGPFGLFTLEHVETQKLVFIGTGTGISPLRSMIKSLFEEGTEKELTLIYGVRHEEEILFEKEFEELENANPNFKFIKVVSRPTDNWEGRSGHVQNNLDSIDPLNSQFFVCGLIPMIDSVDKKLQELGVPKELIHFERYV